MTERDTATLDRKVQGHTPGCKSRLIADKVAVIVAGVCRRLLREVLPEHHYSIRVERILLGPSLVALMATAMTIASLPTQELP